MKNIESNNNNSEQDFNINRIDFEAPETVNQFAFFHGILPSNTADTLSSPQIDHGPLNYQRDSSIS